MAQAPYLICPRCKTLSRGSCGCQQWRKEVGRRHNAENRKRYYTERWIRLRACVLNRDHHLCQECKRHGVVRTGNQVDHVIRAEDNQDLFWSLDNLQTLCATCHSQKTCQEISGQRAG